MEINGQKLSNNGIKIVAGSIGEPDKREVSRVVSKELDTGMKL